MPAYRRAPKAVARLYGQRVAARGKFARGKFTKNASTHRGGGAEEAGRSALRYYVSARRLLVPKTCPATAHHIRRLSGLLRDTLDAAWANSRCGAALIGVLPFPEAPAALAHTGAPRGRANIRSTHAPHQLRKTAPKHISPMNERTLAGHKSVAATHTSTSERSPIHLHTPAPPNRSVHALRRRRIGQESPGDKRAIRARWGRASCTRQRQRLAVPRPHAR